MAPSKPPQPTDPPDEGSGADRHKHTVVSFRPPPELLERLRARARKDKRSVAKLVEILVENGLDALDEEEAE